MDKDTANALDLGVFTLALLHNGGIEVSCSECQEHFQDENHCLFYNKVDTTDIEPVFYSPEGGVEYFNCPISTIPQVVFDLYDVWEFNKEFNVSLTRKDTPAILWWFIKTYNHYSNKIQNHKIKENNKKNKKNRSK